jgi:hypothetical protein
MIMATLPPASNDPNGNSSPSSAGLLVFSWLFVGLPLAWGVMQTLIKSMALFH